MGTLWREIRLASRSLGKDPGFTLVAVLSLSLGIGANTALFSLVDALLLRPLPVSDPDRLVIVGVPSRVNGVSEGTPQFGLFSLPLYRALRDASRSFVGLLASGRTGRLDVRVEGASAAREPEHPSGRMVSGNYFSVLGVRAAVGRTLGEDDDRVVSPPVAVLSHEYWHRRFDLDPGVLGRRLRINGGVFSVVGVAARGFTGEVVGARADLWLPVSQQPLVNPGRNWLGDPATSWLLLMGRLEPHADLERARAELDPLAHRLVETLPGVQMDADDRAGVAREHVAVSPGGRGLSWVRAHFSEPLLLLLGMVGVVLLICCANVANLMLTRGAARTREIAVRLAVGAGRAQLLRPLLAESVVLSLLGTAGGTLLAAWSIPLLLRLPSRGPDPVPLDVHADLRVLGFTLALAAVTAVLFGLAPGLRALRVDLLGSLKPSPALGRSGGAAGHAGALGVGKALVVVQVAVSLLLLTGAGLLVRSLANLSEQEVGFDRDRLLGVETDPVASGYAEAKMDALMRDVSESLSRLPGVARVATSYNGLFSGTDSATLLGVGDLKRTSRDDRIASYDQVGPGYFETLGTRIERGRGIGPEDTETSPKVAVVARAMALHLYPGVDPVGHHLLMGDLERPVPVEIVGVAADVKESGLADEVSRRFFVPISQRPDAIGILRFIVRSAGDPAALREPVRARMLERYPDLQLLSVSPVAMLMRGDALEQRLLAQLSGFFAALALVLAATGLYGVMSYATSLRTNEIGVRMALGAEARAVLGMVLGECLGLMAGGILLGALLAAGALRVLSSRLFGLSTADPPTLAAAAVALTGAVLLAGYLPARRASRVDPIVALRDE